eukprot:366152-Chlamydomonas_euryale.AAC.3
MGWMRPTLMGWLRPTLMGWLRPTSMGWLRPTLMGWISGAPANLPLLSRRPSRPEFRLRRHWGACSRPCRCTAAHVSRAHAHARLPTYPRLVLLHGCTHA